MSTLPPRFRVFILSDVHYASEQERDRGDYEAPTVSNGPLRFFLKQYRRRLWRRDPFACNHYVDRFIAAVHEGDLIIGNGDYCCDSAFIGVSDDPSLRSAEECLEKLHGAFGNRFVGLIGDHDLGKKCMSGAVGGMRLESYKRCIDSLHLNAFFKVELGHYALVGMNSTLIGLPEWIADCPEEERESWICLREAHLSEIRRAMGQLTEKQRLLFFLHDPSALPHLAEFAWIREQWPRLDGTFIGHLHSELIHGLSHLFAGMPRIHGLGHTALKISTALQKARTWKPFKVHLVPAPSGIECWKKGGFGEICLGSEAGEGMSFKVHSLDPG
ncbi:MAG: hypothetical protein P8L18_06260 [Verrucomicrobiota bacterium]|nr:hypothetical protein [Verrucomicrobiota bacterium]